LELFTKLSELFALSLRTQEQIFSQLSVVFRTVESNYFIYPVLLVTLVILKASGPEIYRKFIEGKANARDVFDFIKSQPGGHDFFIKDRAGMFVEAYLVAATADDNGIQGLIREYEKKSESNMLSEMEKTAAKEIAKFLPNLQGREWYGMLPYLVKKIEIAERFVKPEKDR
jgi:hypothetical protein